MSAAKCWRSPERDELLPRLWSHTTMSADAIAVEMNKLPGKLLDGRMTCRYAGRLGAKRSREFFSSPRAPFKMANSAATEYRHLIDTSVVLEDEVVDVRAIASWAMRNRVKPDLESVNDARRKLGLPGFRVKDERFDLRLCAKAA